MDAVPPSALQTSTPSLPSRLSPLHKHVLKPLLPPCRLLALPPYSGRGSRGAVAREGFLQRGVGNLVANHVVDASP